MNVNNPAYAGPAIAVDARIISLSDVHVRVERNLTAVEQLWRRFELRAEGHVFQSFDWVSSWCGSIGRRDGVQPQIAIGEAPDGETLFLLPLGIRRRFGLGTLSWLGGRQADLKGGLFEPEFLQCLTESDWASLWNRIRHQIPGVDLIVLTDQPEQLGPSTNPFASWKTHQQPDRSHSTDLGGDWERFYAVKRPGSARKEDRRRKRKLDAIGKIQFEVTRNSAAAVAIMERLFVDKAKQLAKMGVGDLFADDAVRAFYRQHAQHAYPRGSAHFSSLTLNGEPIAINLGLIFGGRFYYLVGAYDMKYRSLSPGTRLLNELIHWSIEHGVNCFDFGVGDQDYKFEWCENHVELFATARGCTTVGRVAACYVGIRMRLKRLIKRSATLWRMAQAVRRLVRRDAKHASGI
jgi:CelD/BcsL family acetyltransferase involved in cellulose biosynthesis